MQERIIMAGAGGQGTILLGKLLATAAMNSELHVTYLPSYGAEVRGGTANCTVVVSSDVIYSPLVDEVDSLIVMNQPSLDRFKGVLKPGGLLVGDSSMIASPSPSDGCRAVFLPASDTAGRMGNVRVANMIMLGAYLSLTHLVTPDTVLHVLSEYLSGPKAALLPLNEQALARGAELASSAPR